MRIYLTVFTGSFLPRWPTECLYSNFYPSDYILSTWLLIFPIDCIFSTFTFTNWPFYQLNFLSTDLSQWTLFTSTRFYGLTFRWDGFPRCFLDGRISTDFFTTKHFYELTTDTFFINWSFFQQTLLPISTDNFFQQILLPTDIICELTNLNWQLCQPTPKLFF